MIHCHYSGCTVNYSPRTNTLTALPPHPDIPLTTHIRTYSLSDLELLQTPLHDLAPHPSASLPHASSPICFPTSCHLTQGKLDVLNGAFRRCLHPSQAAPQWDDIAQSDVMSPQLSQVRKYIRPCARLHLLSAPAPVLSAPAPVPSAPAPALLPLAPHFARGADMFAGVLLAAPRATACPLLVGPDAAAHQLAK